MATALAVLALALAGCSAEPQDADLVYCLSSTKRTQLVESARSLGLVTSATRAVEVREGGVDLTVEKWREQQSDEFDRSCAAILPPAAGGDEWLTALFSAFNVIIGALLALVSTSVSARIVRRHQAADLLRDASQRLARSVEDLVLSRTRRNLDPPAKVTLLERVSAVESAARRARAQASARPAVTALLDDLHTISGQLAAPWPDGAAAATRAEMLTTGMRALQDRAENLAAALDGPLRLRRRDPAPDPQN